MTISKKMHWVLLEVAGAPAHYSEIAELKKKNQDFTLTSLVKHSN